MFITSGNDGFYKIWDLRAADYVCTGQVSEKPLNCGTFNNVNANLFAISGEDCAVSIWDQRMPNDHLNDMRFHEQ